MFTRTRFSHLKNIIFLVFCLFFILLMLERSRSVMSDMLSQKHCEVLKASVLWEDNEVIVCHYRSASTAKAIGKKKMFI